MNFIGEYLYDFTMTIMSFIFIIGICNIFLTLKKVKFFIYLIWGVAFVSLSIFSSIAFKGQTEAIIILFAVFCTFFYYSDKKRYKLFALLYTFLIIYIFEILFLVVLSLFFNQYYGELNEINYKLYILLLNSIEILLLFLFVYLKKINIISGKIELQNMNSFRMLTILLILLLTTVYTFFIDDYFRNIKNIEIEFSTSFLLFTVLMGIILATSLITIIKNNIREKVLGKTNTVLKEQINLQLEHYSQLEKSLIETRKIKHDMINHMFCLKHLIETESQNTAVAYIYEIENRINAIGSSIETGNSIFDAILNEKIGIAKEHNIEIDFKGVLPKYKFVNLVDMCTITTNSIDNAIEAIIKSRESENRIIKIRTFIKNEHWIYKVKNKSNSVVINSNGLVKTTKDNKEYHGFGLLNIKEAVKKNNGILNIYFEKEIFSLEVILKSD